VAAIVELGARLGGAAARVAPDVKTLPTAVERSSLVPGFPGSRSVILGIEATTLGPSWCRLDESPTFIVLGPDSTGKSTALSTLAAGLVAANPAFESFLLAPRKSPLLEAPWWTSVARGHSACEELAIALSDLVKDRAIDNGEGFLIVIDDGDEFPDGKISGALETVLKRGRDIGVITLAAAQTHVVRRTYSGWLTEARNQKHGLLLQPDVEIDGDMLGVRLPRKSGQQFPQGRGFLARRGSATLIQVAR
jgi:S-DNA-T family DNA segregation ATPase FtsK/SpoIIIE